MRGKRNEATWWSMAAVSVLLYAVLATAAFAESRIAATVDGVVIAESDLEEAINSLIPRATFHGNVTEKKREEFREKALENLIVRELQYQDAKAKGLRPDKTYVRTEMEKLRDRYRSKNEYRKALEQAGLTEDSLRSRFEKESLIALATEKAVNEPAKIGAAALREYYDKNKAKFRQPESVRLRIISTKDEKKVETILAGIKAGDNFGDLAAKMSEDDFRIKGGDIGYIHRGRIYPALEDVAFRLKKGEVSSPIRAEGHWFIVKVEDQQPERELSFDEVSGKLEKDLEKRRAAELKDQWIAELRAKAKIEIRIKSPAPSTADVERK